jgi:hypothetical protein
MKYLLSLTLLLCFQWTVFSQTNEEKFLQISEDIENLLKYKDKSPAQLKGLLAELKNYSKGNETSFDELKSRVDKYILPVEIKLTRSDIYTKNFAVAAKKTKELKVDYPYNKDLDVLEKYLDKKLFSSYKKSMLKTKPSWFSLEPSFAFYSLEKYTNGYSGLSDFCPTYGLGLYVKLKNREKSSFSNRTKFSYSEIGLKLDYRDNSFVLSQSVSPASIDPYFNTQLSFIFRKIIGLDFGILGIREINNITNLYTFTPSFYFPMGWLSLGVHAKIWTDFKSNNPIIQYGASVKFNIGLYKPFTLRNREEIQSQVIKFKEKN